MTFKCIPSLGVALVRELRMFKTLVGKEKNTKLGLQDTIGRVLKHICLMYLYIVHLNLIFMSYDQKKGQSQIGNLTPDHKPFEGKSQMSSDWGMLYTIGNIFLKVIKYYP